MPLNSRSSVETRTIQPTFPETSKITQKTAREVLDLLSNWVKEQWYNFVYHEKKINTLLHMDWISEVKIQEITDLWGGLMVIKAECKAKKEFMKGIRKKILATKVTWNKNNVNLFSWWEWYEEVSVLLYWARIQLFLTVHEQE